MSDPLPGLIVLAIGGWISPPLLLLTIKFVTAFRVLLIPMFPPPKSLRPILQPQTLLIPGGESSAPYGRHSNLKDEKVTNQKDKHQRSILPIPDRPHTIGERARRL